MISFILLASGFGRRFGSNKLMAEIDGKQMYRHILERLRCAAMEPVCGHEITVVVVSQYEEILDTARDCGMKAVMNAEAAEGISASIRLGILNAPDSEWYFFFTADQPYLQQATIRGFAEAVAGARDTAGGLGLASRGFGLVTVHAGGVPGSPTAFHKRYRDDLLALRGDVGGRKILKQHPEDVLWYEISDREITDIDMK